VLHLLSKRREHAIEFLFAVAVLYAGAVHALGLPWLQFAYFPFIIALTRFYGMKVIIPLSVLIPFTELRTFVVTQEHIAWQAAFSLFLILTSAVASLIFTLLRSEKERIAAELEKIREGALDRTQDTEMESLGSDEIIRHYFASEIRASGEIQELLAAVRHAVVAEAAHFFELRGDACSLRCSTDDRGKVTVTGRGVLAACLRERKPFSSGELDEKTEEVGYLKGIKVVSLIAMPVMEGSTPVGLLAVDSSRYHAFNEPEQKTVQMFSVQIAKILERERMYTFIKHDITAHRIIKEFSAGLAASIKYDVVVRNLCEYATRAFSGDAFFFAHDSEGFRAVHFPGEITGGQKIDFAGTIIELAIRNRQKEYVSDIRQYGMRIFPPQFRLTAGRSVVAVPLFYEGGLLGVFGMTSDRREFLDSRQVGLIELMCNQASTSIANAMMHAEIERMATTDGLTGLFNHRVLQETLTRELRRSERQSVPLSLLLVDIDHFKKVNDTYGHPVGDLVLRGVARILKGEIRDIDVAARYGGEEFAVILTGTDGAGAKIFAERLRKTIMEETFTADGRTLRVTASIGIAAVPADAKTKEELIERTDQALYQAKHQGRNRTVNWGNVR
jgi:diguanylate cyclase (GGDEF)-like protein